MGRCVCTMDTDSHSETTQRVQPPENCLQLSRCPRCLRLSVGEATSGQPGAPGWRLMFPQSQQAPPSPNSRTGSWVLGFIGGLLSPLKRGFQELKPARVLGNGTHPGLPPGTGSASQTSYIQAARAFSDRKEPTALPSTTRNAGHLVWAQVVTRTKGCCSFLHLPKGPVPHLGLVFTKVQKHHG